MENQVGYWATGFGRVLADAGAWLLLFLGFVAILVVGYFVAKWLGQLLNAVLEKVGFDKAVERGGIKRALSKSGNDPSDLMGKALFYGLMLFVLYLAFSVFGNNPITALLAGIIAYLPNILAAVAIIVIAAMIASGLRDIVYGSIGGLDYGRTLANVAYAAVLVVGIFAALSQLNIAPFIVVGLFYAMLAIVVGVAIVAIGGGGIQPMRQRWEAALNRAEQELPRMRQHVSGGQTFESTMTYERQLEEPAPRVQRPGEGYIS